MPLYFGLLQLDQVYILFSNEDDIDEGFIEDNESLDEILSQNNIYEVEDNLYQSDIDSTNQVKEVLESYGYVYSKDLSKIMKERG